MADNDQLITQLGKLIDEKLEPINKRLNGLEQGQNRTETALDALKAGQDDIRENMATKQDVERIEQEVDKLKKRLPPYRAD